MPLKYSLLPPHIPQELHIPHHVAPRLLELKVEPLQTVPLPPERRRPGELGSPPSGIFGNFLKIPENSFIFTKKRDMIEPAPKISNTDLPQALEILLDSKNKDILSRIDENYLYWDKVKYLAPDGMAPETLWHAVKLQRLANQTTIRFGEYKFRFTITGKMQSLLHEFDMNFGGNLGSDSIIPAKNAHGYLLSSLMEEAIASSQMEGASTTRRVAKEMLRKKAKPIGKSQQMILNNYMTIQHLVNNKNKNFTVEELKHIHKLISNKTLDNSEDEGRFRRDDNIFVMNNLNGEIAHTPPDTAKLDQLVGALCDFANQDSNNPFVHPIVKGILLHFLLAYFHPFIDGNGRTARSLVYWYMLKQGYWLTEYLSISRAIYKSKAQYENSFLYAEHDGLDVSYFINYNLEAMQRAYIDLKAYLQRKMKEQDAVYELRKLQDINERQAQIVMMLKNKATSFFTVNEMMLRFNVSEKTARNDLRGLVSLGLMDEKPLNKRKSGFSRADDFEEKLEGLLNHKG